MDADADANADAKNAKEEQLQEIFSRLSDCPNALECSLRCSPKIDLEE